MTNRSDRGVSCRTRAAPCVMPPLSAWSTAVYDDPCARNLCKQGALCSVQYIFDASGKCLQRTDCNCPERYVGYNCQEQCAVGQQPCGASDPTATGPYSLPNNVCCAAGMYIILKLIMFQACVELDPKIVKATTEL
jgi:hypothetical protein